MSLWTYYALTIASTNNEVGMALGRCIRKYKYNISSEGLTDIYTTVCTYQIPAIRYL